MEATTQANTNNLPTTPDNGGGDNQGAGNQQLSAAFDKAIAEARKTLETTTIKGADLYALKQSVR